MSIKTKPIKKEKEQADAFSIDELRQLTDKSKDNFEEVFADAVNKALKEILEGYQQKMRDAAHKGHTRTYLYVWKYIPEKTDKTYTFNNIRMLDLLTKGGETQYQGLLMQKLREFFNPDRNRDGYYVSFHKFKNREPAQYGIYVSWYKGDADKDKHDDKESVEVPITEK